MNIGVGEKGGEKRRKRGQRKGERNLKELNSRDEGRTEKENKKKIY